MNGKSAAVALLAFILMISAVSANEIREGWSRKQVISLLGKPTREIGTGKGSVLFYGPIFIDIQNGIVVYSNASAYEEYINKRCCKTQHRAKNGLEEWKRRQQQLAREEIQQQLEKRQRTNEQLFTEKVRRFMLTETFRTVLKPIRYTDYGELRQEYILVAYETDDSATNLQAEALYCDTDDSRDGVTFLNLKDSQGNRVWFYGEEMLLRDRNITVRILLTAEDYYSGQI